MNNKLAFDHIHLISRDPRAAADWYCDKFGGEIATVQENLRFAARAAGAAVESADGAIERLGLTAVADTQHAKLSAGQRRRLALAVAFSRDPELLLLDEPHAGLDADGRELLDAMLAAAPAEGRTVLFASHELDRARAVATREVQVVNGRLVGGLVTSEVVA